jgi:5,10-methylene-tetrahydrofolate dehydrogenase/methenyl tetrahydrofolate cyclohydrolase
MNDLVLTDFYEIHNSKDGKTINFTIDSKVKKFKTVRDVAIEAYKHSQELFSSAKYLNSTSKQEIEAIRRTKAKSLEDAFVEQFEKELIEYLNARKEIRDAYIQSALPSAFRAKFIPAKFSPSSALNEIDKMFVENIVYNVEQDSIYSGSSDWYACRSH